MSRRRAREVVLQALFQLDLNDGVGCDSDIDVAKKALETAIALGTTQDCDTLHDNDVVFAQALLSGVCEKLAELDECISQVARGWKITRMGVIDRNVLRLAAYELKYAEGMTPGIVVNEAVELAKKYGTDESPRFINGVLGALVKN